MQSIDSVTVAELSLILSVVSLGVAIILGVLNWRHTNRSFKAVQYPIVETDMYTTTHNVNRRQYLNYVLQNRSKNVDALDVKMVIELHIPIIKGWRRSKRWLIYDTVTRPKVTESEYCSGDVTPSIQEFLKESCPEVLLEETLTGNIQPHINYRLLRPLRLRLTVTYRPPAFGIKSLTKRDEYVLTQRSESDKQPDRLVWVIRRQIS